MSGEQQQSRSLRSLPLSVAAILMGGSADLVVFGAGQVSEATDGLLFLLGSGAAALALLAMLVAVWERLELRQPHAVLHGVVAVVALFLALLPVLNGD